MECNKDEAVRAKGIAENKLKERDFSGAKKFALKAQGLFPELEGLSKLLDVVNIYVALEHNTYGIVDYYGMLGVDPSADEELIRKQYKRLILSVHPDKNKIDGADGAFVILKKAWEVLSDKDERKIYDTNLNLIRAPNQASSFSSTTHAAYHPPVFAQPSSAGSSPSQPFSSFHHPGNMPYGTFFQYPPTYQWTPPAETAPQGPLYPTPETSTTNSTPLAGNQQSSSRSPPPVPQHQKTPATASAAQSDPASKPIFRYVRSRNQSLETFWSGCNRCRIKYEFEKVLLDRLLQCPSCLKPFLAVAVPAPPSRRQQQDPVVASDGPTNLPPSVARTPQAARGQPSTEYAERGPENVGTASAPCTVPGGLHREKPRKRRRKDGQTCVGAKESRGAAGRSRVKKASEAEQQPRSAEKLSEHQIRAMLMGRAKLDTLNQLNKWKSAKSDTPPSKRVDRRDSLDAFDQVGSGVHPRTDKSTDGLSRDSENVVPEVDAPDEYESMVVPDANFHNFDNGRIEESFTEGQIWAAYDDDDGMPRYYALVQHVLSRCPFKMQIGWLNSKSTSEFGHLDWTASGFTKTIGNFRPGKSVIGKRLNSFSHPVKSVKRARGVIQIFPTKGDVWALYRNWSRNWNETTADEIIHKYELVVVLEDYTEDRGVPVAPLVKVPGFTSVFKQRVDQREIWTILREEMFRFSHQVPFHILSGLEAENAPKNCYELDPAALPLELLNVISDLDSVPRVHKTSSEDTKPLLKYSRRKRNKEKKIGENFFQS